jgi:hypothetical protein
MDHCARFRTRIQVVGFLATLKASMERNMSQKSGTNYCIPILQGVGSAAPGVEWELKIHPFVVVHGCHWVSQCALSSGKTDSSFCIEFSPLEEGQLTMDDQTRFVSPIYRRSIHLRI